MSVNSRSTLAAGFRFRVFMHFLPNETIMILRRLVEICDGRASRVYQNLMKITERENFLHSLLSSVAIILFYLELASLSLEKAIDLCFFIKKKLIPMCMKIYNRVKTVVNDMSPEGFLPKDLSYGNDDFSIMKRNESAQRLLVSCWRSVEHISAIFYCLLTKHPYLYESTLCDLQEIGDYFWDQLIQCRHQGAFRAAVDGFEAFCKNSWNSVNRGHRIQSELWLQEILNTLNGGQDIKRLCVTRRSAGLPFLICGILATEPPSRKSKSLGTAVNVLLDLNEREDHLQVHSLNILRALYCDNRLSRLVMVSLEHATRVCIEKCASSNWSVRNCASQLFSSLLVLIFGPSKEAQRSLAPHQRNKMSAYQFFSRFPSLFDFLHRQFSQFTGIASEFRVFPLLILLSHLYPSHSHMKMVSLSSFIFPVLRILLGCKCEKLRRLSAVTLGALLEDQDIRFLLDWLSKKNLLDCGENQFQAVLLMLEQFLDHTCDMDLVRSIHQFINLLSASHSLETRSGYNIDELLFLVQKCKITPPPKVLFCRLSNVSRGCFSVRQLASVIAEQYLCRSDCVDSQVLNKLKNKLKDDDELRSELWRYYEKSRKEPPGEILEYAVKDLSGVNHRVAKRVLLVISCRHPSTINCDTLKTALSSLICHFKHYPSARSSLCLVEDLARHLLVTLTEDSVDWDWLEKCARRDNEMSRKIAVKTISLLAKTGHFEARTANVCCILLQDELTSLREEVAAVLGGSLLDRQRGLKLNPSVVGWLLLRRFPSVSKVLQKNVLLDNDDDLFSATPSNPYGEPKMFGYDQSSVVLDLLENV
ncbi:hypothetical protein AB6A40_001845 [Gnathostoma spinigerum]|uniref:tRNA (32-2'-O)-methyltransferase regulator THADA n=1 Tax=Gnathostoma spinigerum TaxID=75299 RepID=A0ABD6E7J8_9BILA